ncbi:MAG: hypothetical protein K6G50_04540, partial [bacterium]|nr:hypothetical protein [bacterium]
DLSIYYPLTQEEEQFGKDALHKADLPQGVSKIALHLHERWLSSWSLDDLTDLTAGLASLPESSAPASGIITLNGGTSAEGSAATGLVAITFGPAEKELAERLKTRFQEKYPHISGALAFFGNLSFKQWMSVLKASDVTVSPDTGAIHVAVAAGKPVVAVYEADTADLCSQQWAPWQVPHQSIVKKDAGSTIPAIIKTANSLMRMASAEPPSSNKYLN